MSFFATRYPLRYASLLRKRAANLQGCSCAAQRYNAAASTLECLPGSIGRAKAEFGEFTARLRSGNATGSDAFALLKVLVAWTGAFLVGSALGRRSISGYKLYNQ